VVPSARWEGGNPQRLRLVCGLKNVETPDRRFHLPLLTVFPLRGTWHRSNLFERVTTDRAFLSGGFFRPIFKEPTVTKAVTVATTRSPAALAFGQAVRPGSSQKLLPFEYINFLT
jgi:hypothetical protein